MRDSRMRPAAAWVALAIAIAGSLTASGCAAPGSANPRDDPTPASTSSTPRYRTESTKLSLRLVSSREWEPTEVFQECPDGMVATGGGYELHGDGALVVKVVGSGPATAMGGGAVWRVLLLAAPQAQFTSVSVTVWAVCGPE